MYLQQRKTIVIMALVFFLILFLAYRRVLTHAQESGSLSPTPSQNTSDIPAINRETLADPAAFKLDQEIKRATRDFFNSLQKNESLTVLENKASKRKNLMKRAIQEYAYVFLGNVVPLSYTALLETNLQSYFEKPQTLSNVELEVLHSDDFENQKSQEDFYLQNLEDKQRFTFYPQGEFTGHISGTTLNVNGVALDNEVAARVMAAPNGGEEENNDPVPTNVDVLKEASPDALGPQRMAVILVYPKGIDTANLPSKEQVFNDIINGDIQKFFKEASYGKMWIDEKKSHVYGWYETQKVLDERLRDVDLFEDFDSNIDLTQYDRVVLGLRELAGPYAGWSSVGKRLLEDKQTGYFRASRSVFYFPSSLYGSIDPFTHEFGHALGVRHANGWICDQGSMQGKCQHSEYGNPFDLMGQGYLNHFNAYFKEVFQWLNAPVINITSSGRYTLSPLEYPEAVVAKVSVPGASNYPVYYLEARAPVGFDDDTNNPNRNARNLIKGIHINWNYEPLATRFLSISPRWGFGSGNKTEALRQGQSFQDEKAGLTITNIDDTTVDIQLEQTRPDLECNDDFDVYIDGIRLYKPSAENSSSGVIEWLDAPEHLLCGSVECTLKRNRQSSWLIVVSLSVRNNNYYACPATRVRTSGNASWDSNPQQSYNELLVPSTQTFYTAETFLIPASTQVGQYNMTVKVNSITSDGEIFSTFRDVKIIDEFPILEGDLTADGKVDIFDLVTVAKDFGKKGEGLAGDADRDGDVDIFDLVIVAKNFGKKIE